jgi:ferredoxin
VFLAILFEIIMVFIFLILALWLFKVSRKKNKVLFRGLSYISICIGLFFCLEIARFIFVYNSVMSTFNNDKVIVDQQKEERTYQIGDEQIESQFRELDDGAIFFLKILAETVMDIESGYTDEDLMYALKEIRNASSELSELKSSEIKNSNYHKLLPITEDLLMSSRTLVLYLNGEVSMTHQIFEESSLELRDAVKEYLLTREKMDEFHQNRE